MISGVCACVCFVGYTGTIMLRNGKLSDVLTEFQVLSLIDLLVSNISSFASVSVLILNDNFQLVIISHGRHFSGFVNLSAE